MDIEELIHKILDEYNKVKSWADTNFEMHKAYVSALVSRVPYLFLTENERNNTARLAIIPCLGIRKYASENREQSNVSLKDKIQNVLRRGSSNGDTTDNLVFTFERPYFVVAIIKIRDVIFISVRGTANLYDWSINFNCVKHPIPGVAQGLVHKGFLHESNKCIKIIQAEVPFSFWDAANIYIVGHSLGGAIAAIMHLIWREKFTFKAGYYARCPFVEYDNCEAMFPDSLITHSCYTFGMPRYGNWIAANWAGQQFHMYNERDIVTSLPPKCSGYGDSEVKYCINRSALMLKNGSIYGKINEGCARVRHVMKIHSIQSYIHHTYKLKTQLLR